MKLYTAIIGLALVMLSPACGAQGLSLIENCPAGLEPVDKVLPVQGAHTYRATARFIVDVNGAIVAPSVRASQLVMAGGTAAPVPPTVDRTVIDALKKWRYARRSKPCLGNVQLELLVSI